MNTPQIFLLSTTLYNSIRETRFELGLETTGLAIKQGYRVLLVDASSNPEIGTIFRKVGAEVFNQTEPGMGPSRRQVFSLPFPVATLRDIFFWTELEKTDIVRWIPKIVAPIIEGQCDISIPVRTDKSWRTYPKFQWGSERIANRIYQQITGLMVDPMFGPVGMNYKALRYFASCQPKDLGIADNYIQHVAPLIAFCEDIRILSPGIEVDFKYPLRQREEEDNQLFRQMVEKRLWQLGELADTYFKLAKILDVRH